MSSHPAHLHSSRCEFATIITKFVQEKGNSQVKKCDWQSGDVLCCYGLWPRKFACSPIQGSMFKHLSLEGSKVSAKLDGRLEWSLKYPHLRCWQPSWLHLSSSSSWEGWVRGRERGGVSSRSAIVKRSTRREEQTGILGGVHKFCVEWLSTQNMLISCGSQQKENKLGFWGVFLSWIQGSNPFNLSNAGIFILSVFLVGTDARIKQLGCGVQTWSHSHLPGTTKTCSSPSHTQNNHYSAKLVSNLLQLGGASIDAWWMILCCFTCLVHTLL